MKYIFTTLLTLVFAISYFGQEVTPTTPNKGAKLKLKVKNVKDPKQKKTGGTDKGSKPKSSVKKEKAKNPCPNIPFMKKINSNGSWRINWTEILLGEERNDSKNGSLFTTFGLFLKAPGEVVGGIFDPNDLEDGGQNAEGMRNFITNEIWGNSRSLRLITGKRRHSQAVVTFQYKEDGGTTWNVQFEVKGLEGYPPESGAKKMSVKCVSAYKL